MKESYDEGVANHIGPESGAIVCEDRGEALTGVRTWGKGRGSVCPVKLQIKRGQVSTFDILVRRGTAHLRRWKALFLLNAVSKSY